MCNLQSAICNICKQLGLWIRDSKKLLSFFSTELCPNKVNFYFPAFNMQTCSVCTVKKTLNIKVIIKYSTGMLYAVVLSVRLSVRLSVFTITQEGVDVER